MNVREGQRGGPVAVVGALGGVGATSLALACAHAHQAEGAWFLDIEDASGVESMLGIEEEMGLRLSDLAETRGAVDMGALIDLLPRYAGTPVLTGSRFTNAPADTNALRAVLESAQQAAAPCIVNVDTAQAIRFADLWKGIIVVASLDVQGAARAMTLVRMLGTVDCVLVTRQTATTQISPTQLEQIVGRRVVAHIPRSASLAQAVACGLGPLGANHRHLSKVLVAAKQAVAGLGG